MTIDAHVHVWDIAGGPFSVDYPWLTADLTPIYRNFALPDGRAEMDAAGVSGLVLVQASDSMAETEALLAAAAADDRPVRVVGWLPLDDPARTERLLASPAGRALAGVRHLIHDDPDPRWMARPTVVRSLGLAAAAGLTFDAVAEGPALLAQVPLLARSRPELTIVLDHLGKPPIAAGGWQPWADLLADAAAAPNVVAKISGLNTASAPDWTSDDWRPYVDHAVELFGPERLMIGGDWPFCLQADDYLRVMNSLLTVLDPLSSTERSSVMAGTARRIYRFPGR